MRRPGLNRQVRVSLLLRPRGDHSPQLGQARAAIYAGIEPRADRLYGKCAIGDRRQDGPRFHTKARADCGACIEIGGRAPARQEKAARGAVEPPQPPCLSKTAPRRHFSVPPKKKNRVESFMQDQCRAKNASRGIVVARLLGRARSGGKGLEQTRERLVCPKSCRTAALEGAPCKDAVARQQHASACENKAIRGETNRSQRRRNGLRVRLPRVGIGEGVDKRAHTCAPRRLVVPVNW